ncbi:MAG: hypothetical protein GX335_10360 [Firmicutes bacterium]|nr:hypothetical protein [Bacillota bacterium]
MGIAKEEEKVGPGKEKSTGRFLFPIGSRFYAPPVVLIGPPEPDPAEEDVFNPAAAEHKIGDLVFLFFRMKFRLGKKEQPRN